jgi:hypothetical protein
MKVSTVQLVVILALVQPWGLGLASTKLAFALVSTVGLALHVNVVIKVSIPRAFATSTAIQSRTALEGALVGRRVTAFVIHFGIPRIARNVLTMAFQSRH